MSILKGTNKLNLAAFFAPSLCELEDVDNFVPSVKELDDADVAAVNEA